MPEMLDDPAQIAEPVPAGIGVAERIDLIDRLFREVRGS